MLRMTRLADYAVLLMTHIGTSEALLSANQLADETSLPLPTVKKILKLLARHDLVDSERGVSGGYRLARLPAEITLEDMVHAVEGPIALADCVADGPGSCDLESNCPVAPRWFAVTNTIQRALSGVTLREMMP